MKIIECPRDAMQGIQQFIPTEQKVKYINQLLKVGFDTIDFGSFVSPKAIPQLRDTAQVYEQLEVADSKTKLLAIVANTRGALEAAKFEGIHYVGFPLSLSETFQQRNTNKSIAEALNTVAEIQEVCKKNNRVLVAYLSMGFGNPYNDPYDAGIVAQFADILVTLDVEIISLADTIGVSNPEQITLLFSELANRFPKVEFGAHLHSNPATAEEKIKAAFDAGCKRFDGALKGWGGCPMAEDELVGNLATESIIGFLDSKKAKPHIDDAAFREALKMADTVFSKH